ncbi:MAG: hypothetical protein MUE68_08960 [Bacteroidetes bacterium]|jgi:hypothetical protein|nr:hypothetical protein [Bacteroidota bacterium]
MFPLPFSISPLLLSIFLIYPWALALGVWQVGKLTSRHSNPAPSVFREVGQGLENGDLVSSPHGLRLTDPASAALPSARLIDVADLVVVGRQFPSSHPAACAPAAISHRIPRAPPAVC